MNLRGIDLNLLPILDALVDEAHVSRAADRLHLSQPATSNALARCRALLGDPLLIRGPGGLKLTPAAERLKAPLRDALRQMDGLLARTPPDLATIRQTVRLAMADHPTDVIAAPLLKALRQHAPGIDIVIHPWRGSEDIDRLRSGEVDLTAAVAIPPGPDFRAVELGTVTSHVLMRRDHPAAADFNLSRWIEYPHVLVSGSGQTSGPVDVALATKGWCRRVGAVVPSFALAMQIVLETDFIATLPFQMLSEETLGRLAIFEPPVPAGSFTLYLLRHRRSDDDVAIGFVADRLAELIAIPQISPASGLDGSA